MNTDTITRDGVTYDIFPSADPDYPFGLYIRNEQVFETEAKRDAYLEWWIRINEQVSRARAERAAA